MRMSCVRAAAVALACAAVLPVLRAQSLYTIHGAVPPAPTSVLTEHTGPPGGPCGWPNGPILAAFNSNQPFIFPTAGYVAPPPGGLLGDVAHDHLADLLWATDGTTITSYNAAGVVLSSMPMPPAGLKPLTGLGADATAGLLWLTDGGSAVGVLPPPPPGGVPPFVVIPPFPLPIQGLATDIEWDPSSGTLFVCDTLGFVTNVLVGGGLGPWGAFPAVGMCGPPVVPPLTGLAVDTTTPTVFGLPLTLYVTDGFAIKRIFVPGGMAAPVFYTPLPCYFNPAAGPVNGLAFALHGVTFGPNCSTTGVLPPNIASTGNSSSPGALTLALKAGPPNGMAYLFLDTTALCPPLGFKGCPLYVPPTWLFGPFPVPIGGSLTLPGALPPGLPAGVGLHFQWVCRVKNGGWVLSEGLRMTLGLP